MKIVHLYFQFFSSSREFHILASTITASKDIMTKNNIDLNTNEVNRLLSLMENDEEGKFRELMDDYMDEISNPDNRAETEKLLAILEGKNQIPKGKQVLHPKAAFVIKFRTNHVPICNSKLPSNRPHSKPPKIFVNIVSSEMMGKPSSSMVKNGHNWSLPYSLSPLRMEYDTGRRLVPTFDCCFHPATLVLGAKIAAFKDLIVNTAREGVNLQYEQKKESIKLDSSSYVILKGVCYKNGNPSVMVISSTATNCATTSVNRSEILPDTSVISSLQGGQSSPARHETSSNIPTSVGFTKLKSLKKGFLLSQHISSVEKSENENNFKTHVGKNEKMHNDKKHILHSNGDTSVIPSIQNTVGTYAKPSKNFKSNINNIPITPHFEFVERGDFEMLNHTMTDGLIEPSNRPKYIEYRIYLPGVKSAKSVELDISEKSLILTSSKYHLHIKFPFPIEPNDGKAKFDIISSKLTVMLPVKKPKSVVQSSKSEPIDDKNCSTRIMKKDNSDICHVSDETRDRVTCCTSNKGDRNYVPTSMVKSPLPAVKMNHSHWLNESPALLSVDISDDRDLLASFQELPLLQNYETSIKVETRKGDGVVPNQSSNSKHEQGNGKVLEFEELGHHENCVLTNHISPTTKEGMSGATLIPYETICDCDFKTTIMFDMD
jgi:hypothetical protein